MKRKSITCPHCNQIYWPSHYGPTPPVKVKCQNEECSRWFMYQARLEFEVYTLEREEGPSDVSGD